MRKRLSKEQRSALLDQPHVKAALAKILTTDETTNTETGTPNTD